MNQDVLKQPNGDFKVRPIEWADLEVPKEFIKHDAGKTQYSLVPWEQFIPTVEILTDGAKKYAPDNWKLCTDVSRYKDALFRHLMAYMSGERIDEESGHPHLNHVICNCLFLEWFESQKGKN